MTMQLAVRDHLEPIVAPGACHRPLIVPGAHGDRTDVRVALPDGSVAALPASTWPRIAQAQAGQPGDPILSVSETTTAQAQELLIDWAHPLHQRTQEHPDGTPYQRPFGRKCFLLEVLGRPASVVILATTINQWVIKDVGLTRRNCLDLARIGRADEDPGVLQAMLRLTRLYLAPTWTPFAGFEGLRALCSTSMPGTPSSAEHGRGLYSHDGFTRVRTSTGAKGGGRQKPSAANAIADGARGLWVYAYEPALRDRIKDHARRSSPLRA